MSIRLAAEGAGDRPIHDLRATATDCRMIDHPAGEQPMRGRCIPILQETVIGRSSSTSRSASTAVGGRSSVRNPLISSGPSRQPHRSRLVLAGLVLRDGPRHIAVEKVYGFTVDPRDPDL